MTLPAPRHDETTGRFDLSIMTGRNVLAVDVDPIAPSGSRVELGANPHPLHETAAVGEVGEHDFGRSVDPLGNFDRTGQVVNHSVAAAIVPSSATWLARVRTCIPRVLYLSYSLIKPFL